MSAHTPSEESWLLDDDLANEVSSLDNRPFRVLVVDDEDDVHSVTRLALRNVAFKERPLESLSAYTADEAFRILREPETFSSALMPEALALAGDLRLPDGQRIPMMTPIMMDPPEHTRLRAPLQKTFSPKTVIQLKDKIEALAVSLVEAMAPLGAADFVAAVAEPLPVKIFLEMMGLPDDRIGEFRAMVREVFAPRGVDPLNEVLRMRRIADLPADRRSNDEGLDLGDLHDTPSPGHRLGGMRQLRIGDG